MQTLAKIPTTVFTGFLGAGKTSLIQNLLRHAHGRRIALIVNEFGEVGVDRELLLGCGDAACGEDDIVELANGCICCTVADDFVPTMQRLLARVPPPEHIVIETSGLALPKPLLKAFQWPEIRTRVTVDGVIAVVDAAAVRDGLFASAPDALEAQRAADPALDHDSPLEELFEEQLGAADLVVLNKADLLAEADWPRSKRGASGAAPRRSLCPLRPRRTCRRTCWSGSAPRRRAISPRVPRTTTTARITSTTISKASTSSVPAVDELDAFVARVQSMLGRYDVLRLKGFVAVRGKPMRLVLQGVGDRIQHYFDRAWRSDEARGPPRGDRRARAGSGRDRRRAARLVATGRLAPAQGADRNSRRRRRGDRPGPDAGRHRRPVGGGYRDRLPRRGPGQAATGRPEPAPRQPPPARPSLSVDQYVEQVVGRARLVVLRLLGGRSYWPYGLEQVVAVCRAGAIPLAVLPGDDQPDPELRLEHLARGGVPPALAVSGARRFGQRR